MQLKSITPAYFVSPQIEPDDLTTIRESGFDLVINNRPDDEEPGQPATSEIAQAAEAAGLAYVHIPVGRDGITPDHISRFNDAVAEHGKVFAFCRSGMRSTTLRACALAAEGKDIDTLIGEAATAGYDLSGARPVLAGFAG